MLKSISAPTQPMMPRGVPLLARCVGSGAVAITVDLINGREEEVHEGRVCELFDVFAMCCTYVLVHTAVP